MADLKIDRTFIINLMNERDDNNKKKMSIIERKEFDVHIQDIADQIEFLANEIKQQLYCFVQVSARSRGIFSGCMFWHSYPYC